MHAHETIIFSNLDIYNSNVFQYVTVTNNLSGVPTPAYAYKYNTRVIFKKLSLLHVEKGAFRFELKTRNMNLPFKLTLL